MAGLYHHVWCFISIVLAITMTASGQQSNTVRYNRNLSKQVTSVLDTLLDESKYDKRFRPNFGGEPVKIEINMYIKSLGPVSETEEDFSMDLYFRQMWTDPRLAFNNSGLQEFSLNWLFLEKVWKPDTYFVNGKKSYLHSITVPNKFLRLRQDGGLTYSMRLTIKASCPMHLRKFPLDSQSCPLEIGSYGYDYHDVQYAWTNTSSKSPVGREEGVNLAQYDLVGIRTTQEIRLSNRRDNFSVIAVHFHLKRATGFYLLQVYVPCTLIVSCSWVSFWLDPAAVPARVSLGVTTVLSISTLGFGNRSQMPRTSYATALDWFVILCFAFVFASMIEYAAINFIEKMNKDVSLKAKTKKVQVPVRATDSQQQLKSSNNIEMQSTVDVDAPPGLRHRSTLKNLPARKFAEVKTWFHSQLHDPWTLTKGPPRKVSQIDIVARKVFPLSFAILNVIYWISFMYYIGDDTTDV